MRTYPVDTPPCFLALVRARKQGGVSTGYVLMHGVLHFIMVLDVLSAVLVFFKVRKIYSE